MKKKLLSGSFWMMMGSILSRILGIIYLIPWLMMMGSLEQRNAAQAIFNSAYTPYALFLVLSQSGFPSSIARQIAEYNSENKFRNSLRVFKYGMMVMLGMGIISGVIFWVTAPWIAATSPVVSVKATTITIRCCVPALVILPPMSLIRGFFQGNSDMQPYGISQLWEQLMRVIFIIATTFVIMEVFHGSYLKAVNYSTFAAFVGAVFSLLYLVYHGFKKRNEYREMYDASLPADNNHIPTIFKNIIHDAIPFVVIGSAITIFQFVDQMTFKTISVNLMGMPLKTARDLFTYFSANPNKITAVVISLTTAISETSLPLLAQKQSRKETGSVLSQNIELNLACLIPASILLAILSWEVNGIFFDFQKLGSQLMSFALINSIILALFMNFFTAVQSMGFQRYAVKKFGVGILLKIALQTPAIYFFGAFGPTLATSVAFGLVTLDVYLMLRRNYIQKGQLKYASKILKINIVLLAITFIINKLIKIFFIPESKISAFIYCVVIAGAFGIAYLAALKKTNLLGVIFGTTEDDSAQTDEDIILEPAADFELQNDEQAAGEHFAPEDLNAPLKNDNQTEETSVSTRKEDYKKKRKSRKPKGKHFA
ncbi:MAG TPA: polysaccharide biosynthesis protein [Candidatus Ligilactobacillus excrementigallinarum]|uniref:Polysaccharide biosynthesis protein n=1 Tax=Candidatus Ligilactobacillus excrementigallinarum TaxID=2838641 RepID=A0A9D1UVT4_9LACO|nr:polysaccharide biosynthesis protein [Candidatus Ligilactobacillus excrementigallinarum]